jgi:DNA-binding CsgD family transcriptional regulator
MLESLESLRPLGLDRMAEMVYRQLLGNPAWGVKDIADHLQVRELDVQRAVSRLMDLSLVLQDPESERVRTAKPDASLGGMLESIEGDLLRRQRQVTRAKIAVALLAAQWENSRSEDSFERLNQRGEIEARICELASVSRFEFITLLHEGNMPCAAQLDQKLIEEAVLRGVEFRQVWETRTQEDSTAMAYAQSLVAHGVRIRATPTLPLTMVVMDREIALVPTGPPTVNQGMIQIRATGVVMALVSLFEQIWSTSAGFESGSGQDELSRTECELLYLLAKGYTDQRAANSMNLSLRTVRRLMSDLLNKLGARSRFQAGVYASRQGWLNEQ